MKAKELAKILLENPEAEVVNYQYMGGYTPLVSIHKAVFEEKGKRTESRHGGDFIKAGFTECDLVILKFNWN